MNDKTKEEGKMKALRRFFAQSEFLKMLRRLKEETPFKGVCSKCVFKSYCAPGCIAYSMSFYSDIAAPHPMCQRLYDDGVFPKELLK